MKEKEIEGNMKSKWYGYFKGDIAYDKLVNLRKQYLKVIKLGVKAKKW